MAQSRSFKAYITNRFYNELFDAVSSYLEQNRRDLGVSSRLVRIIDSTELSKLSGMRLSAVAKEYRRQLEHIPTNALSFDERFGMLVDSEWAA